MTEQIIRVDLDEALKLAEAARAMLAALKAVSAAWPYISPKDDGFVDPAAQERMRRVRTAIAQAEAAGIKVED